MNDNEECHSPGSSDVSSPDSYDSKSPKFSPGDGKPGKKLSLIDEEKFPKQIQEAVSSVLKG